MDFKEALKQVQAPKKGSRDNYIVVKFGWSNKFILPHKEGVALIAAMGYAENFKEAYSDQVSRIEPMKREHFEVSHMSHEEYDRYKAAALLNIPMNILNESMEKAQKDAEEEAKLARAPKEPA